jgi:hypothetical protein
MKKYATLDEFLQNLTPEQKEQVHLLRTIIQKAEPKLVEHLKWNASSFVYNNEDRITFNTHYPDRVLLILHMGATRKEDKKGEPVIKDTSGLITWNSDIRGTLTFTSLDEIKSKQEVITDLIKKWLGVPEN